MLDMGMRQRLAESIAHIAAKLGPELGVSTDAAARLDSDIRARRQSPQLFGAYYDLVLAVEADDLVLARQLAGELVERTTSSKPLFWAASLGDRPEFDRERYARLLLPDNIPAGIPDEATVRSALSRVEDAMNLLDRGFPEMADEIRALLCDVVIAVGPTDPDTITFDGSSSYMLWGAIMLNALGQTTVLDTALALAHESGHNLLFGKCARGPLIENDDEEIFAHPLRQDPRPMDGVFHAAYVIARMHQTLERLLEAGVLTDEQRAAAKLDLQIQRKSFVEADAVIRQSGKLTAIGEDAIAAARAQMMVTA